MTTAQATYTVAALLKGKDPTVKDIYTALLRAARARLTKPPAVEDPKKTCIHLNAGPGGTTFAGIHPRKASILLNLRTDTPIKSPRIRKAEQVSRSRHHSELLLSAPEDVDAELLTWLAAAHRLAAAPS
jgi:hypothetical protein